MDLSYPWFEISICILVFIHKIKTLQYLERYVPGLDFRQRTFEVVVQVTKSDVLHANED